MPLRCKGGCKFPTTSHHADVKVLLVLFLARLNLHFTVLLSVLKQNVGVGVGGIDEEVISGNLFAEISEGDRSVLQGSRLCVHGPHVVVRVLGRLLEAFAISRSLRHTLPREITNRQTLHRELFVCVVESGLIALREEISALFIALEAEARYFFDVGEILWRFINWLES